MKLKQINNIISIAIIVSLILLVILVGSVIVKLKSEVKETATIDTIENYHYILTDNDTDYFKKTFKELKQVLKEEVNEEEYAKTISKLFIIDFYSLSTSVNKNDVGGVQFVKEDYRDTFIKIAKDSIYNSVENNIYGDRKQKLPTVTNVEVTNISKEKDDYIVTASITYEENMGYANEVEINIIKRDNILEISSLKEM